MKKIFLFLAILISMSLFTQNLYAAKEGSNTDGTTYDACSGPSNCDDCQQTDTGISGTCTSACNATCTYETCADPSKNPTLYVKQLPIIAWYTTPHCASRTGKTTIIKLPFTSADDPGDKGVKLIADGKTYTQLPVTLDVKTWMCTPVAKDPNPWGTWSYTWTACTPNCTSCTCNDTWSTRSCSNPYNGGCCDPSHTPGLGTERRVSSGQCMLSRACIEGDECTVGVPETCKTYTTINNKTTCTESIPATPDTCENCKVKYDACP